MAKLTFNAQFAGPAGSPPDPSLFNFMLDGLSGSGQIQQLTRTNAVLDGNGNLVLTAKKIGSIWTSAYLTTGATPANKPTFLQQYGSFTWRAKVPAGKGVWPALWAVGQETPEKVWPACGEIDAMEQVPGLEPYLTYAHIHGPGFIGAALGGGYDLLAKGALYSDAFHDYGFIWSPGQIEFTFDGNVYATWTPANLKEGQVWPFDSCGPICLRTSLAIGGVWPGPPDPEMEEAQMLIRWIQAYSEV